MREDFAEGLSVWLMPPEDVRAKLVHVMRGACAQYGTPEFEPHITMLAGMPVYGEPFRTFQIAAARLAPIAIQLTKPVAGDSYFQSVFVPVAASCSLAHGCTLLRDLYERPLEGEYAPHLSVVYGRPSAPAKRLIADAIARMGPLEFVATAIRLEETNGPPAKWRSLLTCELRGASG